ncbi:MAG: hypothetical protein ACHQM6_09195 [Candidatus Kapaibacterium sp.]
MNSTVVSNVFILRMPSKGSYLLFFLGTSLVLIAAQAFVYFQFRRLIRKDFPQYARRTVPIIRWIFLLMNLPLVFLFFRRDIHADIPTLTNIMLYPFTVWEFLMLMWAGILIPVVILRFIRKRLLS